MKVMLPTLGEERQATYSPFLPISPKSGRVLYVPMKHVDAKAGTITFDDEDGTETTLSVTGGNVKLQWKPDFGMRWAALGVDFEMFGKDHQTNAVIYDRICDILGRHAAGALRLRTVPGRERPEDLEVEGQRPDHRRVADLCADRKPRPLHVPAAAAGQEALFRRHPEGGRRVLQLPLRLSAAGLEGAARQSGLAHAWRQSAGVDMPVPFSLLLNLVSASNAHDKDVLWGFISRHAPGVTPADASRTRQADGLCDPLLRRFREADEGLPRARRGRARGAGSSFDKALGALPADADGEAIQNAALNVARKIERYQDHAKQSPEGGPGVSVAFFQMIYQVLIGQERGPRFGSFAALYGIAETRALIAEGAGWSAGGVEQAFRTGRGRPASGSPADVQSGGAPKMPDLCGARGLFACLRRRDRRERARPAVGHQPGADILLAEPAVDVTLAGRLCRRTIAGQRPAAQQGTKGRARARPQGQVAAGWSGAHLVAPNGFDAVDGDRCGLLASITPAAVATGLEDSNGVLSALARRQARG